MRFILMMVMVSLSVAAQVVPPVPDIPGRPEVPVPPDVERIIERQTERRVEAVLRQVEQMSVRLPDPAIQGLERAQQAAQRAINAKANRGNSDIFAVRNRKGETLFNEVVVEYGWKAVEREWVVVLSDIELTRLRNQLPDIMGYVTEQIASSALGFNMLKLKVPQELDSYSVLGDKLNTAVMSIIDRNHLYQPDSETTQASGQQGALAAGVCQDSVRIGMIDSSIVLKHDAFEHNVKRIISQRFIDSELADNAGHGTAVASLLLGDAEQLKPLLPAATLYSAAVFYQHNDRYQSGSLFSIIRALDWLNSEKVPVINMSLTGPDNQVLRQVVQKSQQNGSHIVAAVGNAGPAAAPLYPAAYPEVLAVTAVDSNATPYRWAVRGEHVDFAGLGVNVTVADAAGGLTVQSGTSLAAPLVSAHLVCALHHSGYQYAAAITKLRHLAIDNGVAGHDIVYGYGVLHSGSESAAER